MVNAGLSGLLYRAVHLYGGTPFAPPSCMQGNILGQGLFVDQDSRAGKEPLWEKCTQEVHEQWKQSVQEIQSEYAKPYEQCMASHLQKAQEHAGSLGITEIIDGKMASGIWQAFSKGGETSHLTDPEVELVTGTTLFHSVLSEEMSAIVLEAFKDSQEQGWTADRSQSEQQPC